MKFAYILPNFGDKISATDLLRIAPQRNPVLVEEGGERRTVVFGSGAEIRAAIDEYARVGLDYHCASILHPSAEEIVADRRKFAS